MKALFDTNILIDHLNGESRAHAELRRFEARSISIITWVEVMIGADPATVRATEAFLATFTTLPIGTDVARRAVDLRRRTRIKLPDALVWATAQVAGALLVTRNTEDFPADDPGVRMPYRR